MPDLDKLSLPQVSCYLRHTVLPHAARDLETLRNGVKDPTKKEAANHLREALAVFTSLALRLTYEEDDDG